MAAPLRPVAARPTEPFAGWRLLASMRTSALSKTLSLALAVALAAAVALPLLWAAGSAIAAGLDSTAWRALAADPQLPHALLLSVATGVAATIFSVAAAAFLLSRSFPGPAWSALVRALPPMLAVPHAAFAIGLAFLIAPSGWLLRALSPWATGFDAPPLWVTTQDPWGLALVVVLVAKEVPFLLWAAATQLQRPDAAARWTRELQLAQSMGYSPRRAWWRVLWPQLWPRLGGPALAVFAYSLTVVDMALVIGPTGPPTLGVLAWQWLLDADPRVNAQGAAAAWLLAGVVSLLAGAVWGLRTALHRRARWVDGRRGAADAPAGGVVGKAGASGPRGRLRGVRNPRDLHDLHDLPGMRGIFHVIAIAPLRLPALLYLTVMLALAVGSVSGVWPFPQLWPQTLDLQAWRSVSASAATLWTTLGLAAASSITALVWAIAWLECAPPAWDRALRRLIYLPLLLPAVLWVVGMHRLGLAWQLDAQWTGLWLTHSLAGLPYVLIALSPAYLGFDLRYVQAASSLGRGQWSFLWRVKWPLLKASLTGAAAVGFAVSVAQYLPTVFIGAGRFATVTTEAVTLASAGQRSLTAAYAWLQWLLPALVFGVAAWASRPRRFRPAS